MGWGNQEVDWGVPRKIPGGLGEIFQYLWRKFGKNWVKSAMKLEKIKVRGWELMNFEGK